MLILLFRSRKVSITILAGQWSFTDPVILADLVDDTPASRISITVDHRRLLCTVGRGSVSWAVAVVDGDDDDVGLLTSLLVPGCDSPLALLAVAWTASSSIS